MDSELLEKVLSLFKKYYTITKNNSGLFDAEAEFRSHNEQYVLVRSAKIADIDSNDFAYFKMVSILSAENVKTFCDEAWRAGLLKVVPYYGHRNSDVTLVILAERVSSDFFDVARVISKINFRKIYKCLLFGWSNFRLCVLDLSNGKCYCNRYGKNLKKVFYSYEGFNTPTLASRFVH